MRASSWLKLLMHLQSQNDVCWRFDGKQVAIAAEDRYASACIQVGSIDC